LGERARLEVLYAFQVLWLDGAYAWIGTGRLQGTIDLVTSSGASSLLEVTAPSGHSRAYYLRQMRVPVERVGRCRARA
jgi:hypothetical protein